MGMVTEEVSLFLVGTTAGVEAARGVLTGGGQGDALLGKLLHSLAGVLGLFDVLKFGFKSSCFVAILVAISEACLSEESFWKFLDIDTTCACPVST